MIKRGGGGGGGGGGRGRIGSRWGVKGEGWKVKFFPLKWFSWCCSLLRECYRFIDLGFFPSFGHFWTILGVLIMPNRSRCADIGLFKKPVFCVNIISKWVVTNDGPPQDIDLAVFLLQKDISPFPNLRSLQQTKILKSRIKPCCYRSFVWKWCNGGSEVIHVESQGIPHPDSWRVLSSLVSVTNWGGGCGEIISRPRTMYGQQ